MAQLLRQGTSVAVHIGPALTTGGLAVQTAITTTGTAKRIIKHLATAAVTVTGAITHISVGHFRITLGTGHTGTLGHLTLAITATAGTNKSLPMWQRYMVVPANVYDSMVSGTTKLSVGTLTSAAVVWTAGTRTLTSAAVAWTAGTRLLTSGAAPASSVWAAAARTLTSAGVAWTAAARTLTSGGAVSDSVWVETARTLTSAGVVWTAAARGLTSKVGYALTSGQHDSIGTRTWAVTARTLTSAAVVWTATGRTLLSGGNVASSVWGKVFSDVTGVPASPANAGKRLAYIYVGAAYKRVTTATGDKLHSSASVGIAKAPISRTSIVFTRGKFGTVTG